MISIQRNNNFDLIRLIAALQVAVFHGVGHLNITVSGINSYFMHFFSWLPGVPIFFFISGFLISASFERNTNLRIYFINRLLRIYPGLWVCFLVGVISVWTTGFFGTIEKIDIMSWVSWIMAQVSLGQFYNPDFLRGYGIGALNGSLWTIPVELQFYLCLPVLYFLGRRFGVWPSVLFVLLSVLSSLWLQFNSDFSHFVWYKLFKVTLLPYFYMFSLGMLCWQLFDKLKPIIEGRFFYWLGAFIVCCLLIEYFGGTVGGNHPHFLVLILYPFLILSLAFTFPDLSGKVLKGNDLSYGIYIYHALVINYFVQTGVASQFLFISYLLIVFLCAFLSWKIIEKPALKCKSSLLMNTSFFQVKN